MASNRGVSVVEYASWSVLVSLVVAVGLAGALAGCAHLIPTGRVVDEARFLGASAAPAAQEGNPVVDPPVLPFPVWGLHFDEELVLELVDHPTWRMIEIVRLQLPDRGVWFTLDSHRCGRQWAGVPAGNEAYASGFPAPTFPSDLVAERSQTTDRLRYRAEWTMRTGERIAVEADSPLPLKPIPLRNGNAMNHSQETALAVIDLELRRAARVRATIDGESWRVGALSRGFLVQTAAGLMEGTRTLHGTDQGGLRADAGSQTTDYRREATTGGFSLVADGPLATERWRFEEAADRAHLAEVVLEGAEAELLRLRFNPPLADLRLLPAGRSTHRMTASVHGRPGYMSAQVHITPVDAGIEVQVLPLRPRWTRQRPVLSRIHFIEDGSVEVDTEVHPTAPWSFGNTACPDP